MLTASRTVDIGSYNNLQPTVKVKDPSGDTQYQDMHIYEIAGMYKYRHRYATTVAFEPSNTSSHVGSLQLGTFYIAALALQS